MRIFFLIFFFVFTFNSNLFSKQIDSLKYAKPDTLGKWYAGNVVPKKKFKLAPFIVPVALAGYGFVAVYDKGAFNKLDVSTRNEIQEDHPHFVTSIDDYLQFTPPVAVFVLNLSGVKGKHNLFDASMLYLTSAALMAGSTYIVKNSVGRLRPDNSEPNSFPSGHTASAFMAAEFLHQEYKDVNPWIGYAGYFVATATGTLRMYNNRHWFSDVVAGAGFGIASTKISYLVYPYIKRLFISKKGGNFTLMPYYGKDTKGLILAGKF